MKNLQWITIAFALCGVALAAHAQKAVETLNNESIEKAKDLGPITVSEQFQSLPESEDAVGLTFSEGRKPQSELGKRAKSRQTGQGGYRYIDIRGPKAPAVTTKYTVKQGPAKSERGTIRVVEFWATWCGPCKQTIPILTQIQSKFANKNVQVIGISSEEDLNVVRAFVNQQGNTMNYTVGLDPEWRTSAPFSGIWQVNSIPHAYLVSHDNRILWHGHPGNASILEAAISEAIQYRDGTP